AAGRVAHTAADQIGIHASGRLLMLALETFAPAAPWGTTDEQTPRRIVEALRDGQRAGERCQCRDLLPVSAFFHFDVATDSLVVAGVAAAPDGVALPPPATLAALAREEMARARRPRLSSIHLVAEPALGSQAAITVVQHDAQGSVTAVVGLLADTRRTIGTMFGPSMMRHGPVDSSGGRPAGVVLLDSLSLQVASDAGTVLFGRLGERHTFRARSRPRGPLEGLTITVALASGQIPSALVAILPRGHLWHFSVLLLCTLLVTAMAVGSSRREAQLASARSDFIAGVSHDLRMPLAQILIAGETLTMRRDRGEDERLGLASTIVRETQRLIALVENVLLFSRSGAVELEPALEPLPVRALLDEAREAVRLAATDAGQAIDVHAEAGLMVVGDHQLLRQALVNLLDNALKYGTPGQRIRLDAIAHSPTRVHLRVEDQGAGVPRAERERVFDAYERLARDQDSERTGTGLGLAIVRQIARACQGRVWLEDAPAGGIRAVLELPAAVASEKPARVTERV
ncbi:MAG TPA: HAMP domain-containing sensor histidine kinase, partial [Gemmatimonadaceae bacterium]|nr:HAMP domain-containing sensor histidine kinase [Gemmatimonadaceae bacterium]